MLKSRYRITANGKILVFQMILFFICTTGGLTWKTYIINKEWDDLLSSGMEVSRFHLDNRSVKQDEALIKSQYIDPLMKKSITIVANNKSYTLDNSKLIKKYSIESTYIKPSNLEKKLRLYEKSMILKKGVTQLYNVDFNYDENYINEIIKTIENEFNHEAVNANIQILSHKTIKINPATKGYKINKDELKKEIKEKINNKNSSDMIIEAPIIDSEAVIYTDKISSINAKISSFATNFSNSSFQRSNNIGIATKLINGTILMPGQIFSYNELVGERTKARGFMTAPIIVGGEIDSGIGGGICQVSSTLYNAVLRSGIKPLERTNHTLPSSYVKLGLDATVNWNNVDFKFKNTLNYPIYLESYTQNKNLYINIYANSSLLSRKYVISSKVYKKTKPVIKNVKDPNMIAGKTATIRKAHNGYKVKVTRDTYENERLVTSEIISDDEYPAVYGIIKIGTK